MKKIEGIIREVVSQRYRRELKGSYISMMKQKYAFGQMVSFEDILFVRDKVLGLFTEVSAPWAKVPRGRAGGWVRGNSDRVSEQWHIHVVKQGQSTVLMEIRSVQKIEGVAPTDGS